MSLNIKATIDQNVADMIKRYAAPQAASQPAPKAEPVAGSAGPHVEAAAPKKSFFSRLFGKIFG